jgi:hypothetical protein
MAARVPVDGHQDQVQPTVMLTVGALATVVGNARR